ncbi:MAG: hypothetical protein DBX51_02135 [Clostridiales bacterium]|nr:MAG: hypothetical protein DBX51_02135 [Clostridiales bacterium]
MFEKTSGIPKEVPRVFPGKPQPVGNSVRVPPARRSLRFRGNRAVLFRPPKRRWGKEDAFTVNTGEGEESRGKPE